MAEISSKSILRLTGAQIVDDLTRQSFERPLTHTLDPGYLIAQIRNASEYRQQAVVSAGGVFVRTGRNQGSGTVLADFAAPAFGADLPFKEEYFYNLAKLLSDSLEGRLGSRTISGVTWARNPKSANFSHLEDDGPSARLMAYFRLRPTTEADQRNVPVDLEPEHRPLPDEYTALCQAIRKLNARAEEGIVVNGKGVALLCMPEPPIRLEGSGRPSSNEAWLKLEREWSEQHPERKVITEKLAEVTGPWLALNSIRSQLAAQYGTLLQNVETDVAMKFKIVFFETTETTKKGINDLDPTYLGDKKNTDAFMQSQAFFDVVEAKEARQGQFAKNGLGWKSIFRFAPPDEPGEMSQFDFNYQFVCDVASELFTNPRHVNQDILVNIRALSFKINKSYWFRPVSLDNLADGEPAPAKGKPSYAMRLDMHVVDPDAIGKGFPQPISEADKSHLPWWKRWGPDHEYWHSFVYALWYLDQIDSNYRARNYYNIFVSSRGVWDEKWDKYNIYNGITTKDGDGLAYLELDAPDIRGGTLTYAQGVLEWLRQLREWSDREENSSKIIKGLDHILSEGEMIDPVHDNWRNNIFFYYVDPLAQQKNPNNYPLFVLDSPPGAPNFQAYEVNADAARTAYEHISQISFKRSQRAFDGVRNADGLTVSVVNCPGFPQVVIEYHDSDMGADYGRYGGKVEGNRRRTLQQALIRTADRLIQAREAGQDILVVKMDHTYGWHHGPEHLHPGLDLTTLVITRDKRLV